jgi:hypothetical protein
MPLLPKQQLTITLERRIHNASPKFNLKLMALCDVQWVASALGLAAFVRGQVGGALVLYGIRFVQDQVSGALSYAAVPRVGLGPTTPP